MNEDTFHLGIKTIIRDQEGKILLLKVNKKQLYGFDGEPYWDIPGGRIQRGGTVEDTLKREVEEETGIKTVKEIRPLEMVLSNIRIPLPESDDVGLILYVNTCEVDHTENIVLSEEHTDFDWFNPEEAAKRLEFKYPKELTEKVAKLA